MVQKHKNRVKLQNSMETKVVYICETKVLERLNNSYCS